jgi:uncharacterized protein YjbI with pentapeptide repeats
MALLCVFQIIQYELPHAVTNAIQECRSKIESSSEFTSKGLTGLNLTGLQLTGLQLIGLKLTALQLTGLELIG